MDVPPPSGNAATGALRFAAIEAGGTKFNVGIGGSDGKLEASGQFATRSPDETLSAVIAWLDEAVARSGPIAAVGIATFGPVDTDVSSTDLGRLGPTPKVAWRGVNLADPFRRFDVPLGLDTDVNGAALAELRWGAAEGCKRACYLTVGTGIGGGAVLDGRMLSGRSHPEMGHMFVRRHPRDDFPGTCPAHGDCLEGLASGDAIKARWKAALSNLDAGHPGHEIVAGYLAQACVNIVATLAPERIVLGGGVIAARGLLAMIQDQFDRLANDYFSGFRATDIVLANLFPVSGLIGGLAIADMALSRPGAAA